MSGFYCIAFIEYMLAGSTLLNCNSLFSANDYKKNEKIIYIYIYIYIYYIYIYIYYIYIYIKDIYIYVKFLRINKSSLEFRLKQSR